MKMKILKLRLTIKDFSVRCYKAGTNGPSLILLHGVGMDSTTLSWDKVILPLSQFSCVYAVDLPGYGVTQFFQNKL